MFEQLGLVEEVFSLGDVSRCVGREMANLPMAKTRRRNLSAANDEKAVKASIIFVDRSLDLATVTGHDADDVVSALLRLLPPLPSHNVDVKIDLAPLIPKRKKRKHEKTEEVVQKTEEEEEVVQKTEEEEDVVQKTEEDAVAQKTEEVD